MLFLCDGYLKQLFVVSKYLSMCLEAGSGLEKMV